MVIPGQYLEIHGGHGGQFQEDVRRCSFITASFVGGHAVRKLLWLSHTVNLMTKFTSARLPALRGGESPPRPAFCFLAHHQLLSPEPSECIVLTWHPDILFPFLYLLCLSLPHSLKTEGVVELPWQPPTPTFFSVPPQFFCILIRSLFIVHKDKAAPPSSAALQRRFPVCREC